jgi:CRP-like cAMP-binding protein
MLAKLERRTALDAADREALQSLPFTERHVEAGRYIVREGARPDACTLLVEGFAFRQKLTADGCRQIVSIHIPGDFFDLEGTLLNVSDHNVQTLTRSKVATIPASKMLQLMDNHPGIARILWIDTLIDASIYREWVMNVGRRDAKQRIAHLICEIGFRLELAGLANASGFDIPMSQDHLADATGLTAVHVNRSIRALEAEGLLSRNKRFISIPDWNLLSDFAGFNPLYLHLDQAA